MKRVKWMDSSAIKVSAPATIANLGPGFDLVGLALDRPRDVLEVRMADNGHEDTIKVTGVGSSSISKDPAGNACMVAARAVLKAAGRENCSLLMVLEKGVPTRMGLGSSGASSAAGAFAVNHLLGEPLTENDLLRCALEGERVACGYPHADNVAPSLFGGLTVILGYEPLKILRLDPPSGVEIAVISPVLELGDKKTQRVREVLPAEIPFATVTRQMGSFASLLLGAVKNDPKLMGAGISGDMIVEPVRAKLIPGFAQLKKAALEAGALGFSISGAGPSVFALCPPGSGAVVGKAVASKFAEHDLESDYALFKCSREGTMLVN
jgi:homoserine kinase